MNFKNASYRKTFHVSSVTGVVVVAAGFVCAKWLSGFVSEAFITVFVTGAVCIGLLLLLIAFSCVLVELRDVARRRGEADMFLSANCARSEYALRTQAEQSRASLPLLRHWLGAPQFVVGERVRIRSADEIAATLDARGCIDGLPFMPEMTKFCGTVGSVFRCVDKVYDYGGKKDLRRLKDTVLVTGLRCDGVAHDGCQAGCYLLWKTDWLARADAIVPANTDAQQKRCEDAVADRVAFECAPIEDADAQERKYVCQYTEIVNASTRMAWWDPRQDLRPLISGNVKVMAFAVAMLTRLFNSVQRLRGGTGYPQTGTSDRASSQAVTLGLQPGELVRVASPEKIFGTLNKASRNFGLWFDREMLKHCALRYPVLRRVEKIVDDASCRMIRMKTPCLILDGADSSGEFLRFCAQSDHPYWREAWLERVEDAAPAHDQSTEHAAVQALN